MSDNGSNNHRETTAAARATDTAAAATQANGRRRTPWPLMVVAALFIVVPFFAWYGTWFGRALDDADIEKYLKEEKPRHVQHALSEVEKRIAAGGDGAKRWYPQVVAAAAHPSADVRLTAAWVMGADTHAPEFHEGLLRLLADDEPIVRRNAALSLVSFGDAQSRAELRAMLKPYTVRATKAGTALTVLTEGSPVRRETMLVRVRVNPDSLDEVRAPLDGRIEKAFVKEGDEFQSGRELFVLAPDAATVEDALIGLSRLGEAEDLGEVERYAQGVAGMPESTKRRAAQTVEAIKRRAAQKQTQN